jgi:hypothetical protein
VIRGWIIHLQTIIRLLFLNISKLRNIYCKRPTVTDLLLAFTEAFAVGNNRYCFMGFLRDCVSAWKWLYA